MIVSTLEIWNTIVFMECTKLIALSSQKLDNSLLHRKFWPCKMMITCVCVCVGNWILELRYYSIKEPKFQFKGIFAFVFSFCCCFNRLTLYQQTEHFLLTVLYMVKMCFALVWKKLFQNLYCRWIGLSVKCRRYLSFFVG